MQCRGEWKLARVSTMCINHACTTPCFEMRVFRASFHSPLQLRGGILYAVYFMCILYVYVHVDIACVFCVLTIVENYVDL